MDYTEVAKLESKIKYFEDMLLRSKNIYEQLKIQEELMKLRIKLQKLQQINSEKNRLR